MVVDKEISEVAGAGVKLPGGGEIGMSDKVSSLQGYSNCRRVSQSRSG